MKSNVGTVDRIIRLIAGIAIGTIGILNHSWWGVLGIIPLFTASIAWCPLYLPFGLSTKCNCHNKGCKCNDKDCKCNDKDCNCNDKKEENKV